MGIPRIYHRWLKLQPGIIQMTVPQDVASISLDYNQVPHAAKDPMFGTGNYRNLQRQAQVKTADPRLLEQQLFNSLIGPLTQNIITSISPNVNVKGSTFHTLVIAVDGVAPMAKLQQQARRRLVAAMGGDSDVDERLEDRPILHSDTEGYTFDSNSITPGTEFMMRLDTFLKRWIASNELTLPPNVIYSSHMVPGEGEHKIMQLIRDGVLNNEGQGAHVIYSADADMIMLAMLSPLKDVYIYRPDFNLETREESFSVISIENFKRTVMEDLRTPTAIHDFVIMTFLIGNDFLPHMHAFHNIETTMEKLLGVYKEIGLPLVDIQGTGLDNNTIHWPNLATYLQRLAQEEPELLLELAVAQKKYPSRMLVRSLENFTGGEVGLFQSGPIAQPIGSSLTRTRAQLNYTKFRNLWYQNAFSPKGDIDIFKKMMPEVNFLKVSPDKVVTMAQEYFRGMAWIYSYYTQGTEAINNRYIYKYNYAPLLSDLAAVAATIGQMDGYLATPEQEPLNPIHQLLAVMPLKSKNLVPIEVQHLMSKDSPIADRYPIAAVIEKDGIDKNYQGVVLLPFVDIDRITTAVMQTSAFTEERVALFQPADNVQILRDAEYQEDISKRAKLNTLVAESSQGRGRGRGSAQSSFSGRGRSSSGRGSFQGRGRSSGYSGRGYQGSQGRGGYQGRGRSQDIGRSSSEQTSYSSGRGGRGTGRGRSTSRGIARGTDWERKQMLM